MIQLAISIIEQASQPMGVFTHSGQLTFVNKAFLDFFKLDNEPVEQESIFTFVNINQNTLDDMGRGGSKTMVEDCYAMVAGRGRVPVEVTVGHIIQNFSSESLYYIMVMDLSEVHEVMNLKSRLKSFALRRQLTTELHDGVSQDILALGMYVERLQKAVDGKKVDWHASLKEMQDIVKRVQKDMRGLIQQLRHDEVDSITLDNALLPGDVVAFAVKDLGLKIKKDGLGRLDALPEAVKHTLGWVIREFLINTYKHANNKNVSIAVTETPKALNLTLQDSGKGFKRQKDTADKAGYGLDIMRERVESIPGATFNLTSRLGHGTCLDINIKK